MASYDFSGKRKEKLRQAERKLVREGFQIREMKLSEVGLPEVLRVSDEWRSGKQGQKEVRFLNRPIDYNDESDVRKLFVFAPDGKLVAFYFFDPIYRDEQIIGYSFSFKRSGKQAPTGTGEAAFVHAVRLFQAEQREVLTLGLIPFYQLQDGEFPTDWVMHYAFSAFYKWDWFYNLHGQADYKHRFRGRAEKLYFATPTFPSVRRLLGLGRLSNLF